MVIRLVELNISGKPPEMMERLLKAAALEPVPDTVVFPELCTTGYVLDEIPGLAHTMEELEKLPPAGLAAELGIWMVAGTYPVLTPRGIVNMLPVYDPGGRLVYSTSKVHLFRQMGEDRVFVPGSCGGVFDYHGTKAAGMVCYDLRFPELARRLVLSGAEVIFVPAQWPKGRRKVFRALLRARAAEAQIFVVGCNLGGKHLGVAFEGGGAVVDPSGRMLRGISVAEGVRDFRVDLSKVREFRKFMNCLEDRRPKEYL